MSKEIFQKENEHFLSISTWDAPGLVAGFTTRRGGVSQPPYHSLNLGQHVLDNPKDVVKNRKIVADSLKTDLNHYVFCEQTHERTIKKVTSEDCGRGVYEYETALKGTDGIYTKDTNVFLALGFADCVPIYFYAPKHRLIGLAHAGWRGTVLNIATEMVMIWHTKEHVPLEDIKVVIGPAIAKDDYIVDEKVITKINEVLGEVSHDPYEEVGLGQYLLDLKTTNALLLQKAGLSTNSIEMTTYATREKSLFFSHRLEKGQTGRMYAIIGWKGGE